MAANHQLIWDGLRGTELDMLHEALATTSDATVRGWLELVVTSNPVRSNPAALATVVGAWTRRYPGHPANATFVPALIGDELALTDGPQQIALLLPLSGRSQVFAAAIRDGFLAAYITDRRNDTSTAPRVRVYDVSTDGASATLRQALLDGADLVVGPLTKTAVAELALQPTLPVTTLALNRLPADVPPPGGLYQFGLAPEDEARAAAERAIQLGLTRAIALVPHGDLGERLLTSFAVEFEALGGTLLDIERFEPAETDFSAPIRRLLQIQSSLGRRQRLQNLLGERVEYEPRRRQDIDVIFLPAPAATARLIKPQLTFHYAGDIPTFATAQIANDDGRDSRELTGIEYADIPWLTAEPAGPLPALATMADYWRRETQIRRLYALGMDAYRLTGALTGSASDTVLNGASGTLDIGPAGVVRRRLVWMRFDGEQGEQQPVFEPLLRPLEDYSWQADEDRIGSD